MSEKLVFFDIAGTLVDGNPWRGFFRSEDIPRVRLWRIYPVVFPLYGAMRVGLIADARFRQTWIRQIATLLRGLSWKEVRTICDSIVQRENGWVYRERVVEQLQAHKRNGDRVLLISGMFAEMSQAFAARLGADGVIGTKLDYDANGKCTGQIVGEGCAGSLKVEFLKNYLEQQGLRLDAHETFAYADSFSDLPLLLVADHSIAVYPDAKLEAYSSTVEWDVIGEVR